MHAVVDIVRVGVGGIARASDDCDDGENDGARAKARARG
jgi:hypothetical protein